MGISQNPTSEAIRHLATSHYQSQCWPRSMSAFGVTRLPWVKVRLPWFLGISWLCGGWWLGAFWCQMKAGSGPVICLLLGVSSDYARPITGQVTEVACPVIGWAQPGLTRSKRQKTGPVFRNDVTLKIKGGITYNFLMILVIDILSIHLWSSLIDDTPVLVE